MFGSLGGPEIILIFMVALIVFGPKRLPEIGRKVGGVLRELRRATGDFRSSVEREIGFDPLEGVERARRARRDVLSSVSEPLREVAEETLGAARAVRGQVSEVAETSKEAARSLDEPARGGPAPAGVRTPERRTESSAEGDVKGIGGPVEWESEAHQTAPSAKHEAGAHRDPAGRGSEAPVAAPVKVRPSPDAVSRDSEVRPAPDAVSRDSESSVTPLRGPSSPVTSRHGGEDESPRRDGVPSDEESGGNTSSPREGREPSRQGGDPG